MQRNMKQWIADTIAAPVKKATPILSFPAVQLMNVTVRDLISSSDLQAKGMKMVADKVPSGASVSLMDLSVEAEAFGAQVRFTADEVPAIIGQLVSDEDEANALADKLGAAFDGCETTVINGGQPVYYYLISAE